jgi:eukaryotic-like serine/threonine-protein kinase
LANGILYFGSNDGALRAASGQTGAVLWTYQTGNAVVSSPAVSDGRVYVGSDDGSVYAFALSASRAGRGG